MIIDCHAHYEPRILDENKLIENMDRNGIQTTVLISHMTDPPEIGKPEFAMRVQRFMYNRTLLRPPAMALTWLRNKIAYRPSAKVSIVSRPVNDGIDALSKKYPDRFWGWIFVNPLDPDWPKQIEKYRTNPSMIGIKLHPFWHFYPIRKAKAVFEKAAELQYPVLLHLGFGPSGDYRWILRNFKNLNVVFGHLGVPYYKSLWKNIAPYPNAFVDISSTYHVDPGLLRQAISAIGVERILFGTDAPYAHSDVIERTIAWVNELGLSKEEKEKIFSQNFLKIIRKK